MSTWLRGERESFITRVARRYHDARRLDPWDKLPGPYQREVEDTVGRVIRAIGQERDAVNAARRRPR